MAVQERSAQEIAQEIVSEIGVLAYHGGGRDLKAGARIALQQLERGDVWTEVLRECRRLGQTTEVK